MVRKVLGMVIMCRHLLVLGVFSESESERRDVWWLG